MGKRPEALELVDGREVEPETVTLGGDVTPRGEGVVQM